MEPLIHQYILSVPASSVINVNIYSVCLLKFLLCWIYHQDQGKHCQQDSACKTIFKQCCWWSRFVWTKNWKFRNKIAISKYMVKASSISKLRSIVFPFSCCLALSNVCDFTFFAYYVYLSHYIRQTTTEETGSWLLIIILSSPVGSFSSIVGSLVQSMSVCVIAKLTVMFL